MSSRNFNNNSNSTSVVADQAPGDDEECVEGDAEAVEAEQAPVEADAEQAEGAATEEEAPVEAEQAPEAEAEEAVRLGVLLEFSVANFPKIPNIRL